LIVTRHIKKSPGAGECRRAIDKFRYLWLCGLIGAASATGFFKGFDFLFGIFLGKAIMFFQLAKKLIFLAVIERDIVIGELAPGLFDFARDLPVLVAIACTLRCLFLIHKFSFG